MKKRIEIILLILILFFALFIRVYALGSPNFWIDESISSITSLNILDKGLPIFDSGLFYGRAYLFHYLQAFFLLFGETDFLARFVSVIFGLLTIVLAYFIGKEYSKPGGIIVALFTAVFYLEVFYSRQARFYQFFQLLFFLSLYLLYKSKDNPKWLYVSLISFFITINTQIAGLVLAPFFILHILIYNKKWKKYLSIIPAIPLVYKFISLLGLSSKSASSAVNFASKYFSYVSNIKYLFVLFIPGLIWSFLKKKRLSFLIIVPSFVLLIGIVFLNMFALRYSYFFVFPLVLYSSLLISFLYERYGKIMLISLLALLIVPSNLIFPYTYVNVILPIDYNYNDYSAPEIDFKSIPQVLIKDMKENILLSLFSPNVEWYIKKPDYVFDFSMTGRIQDSVSYQNPDNKTVDVYSGARIIRKKQDLPHSVNKYYVIADYYSLAKLKPEQMKNFNKIIKNCSIQYENIDMRIYYCE